MRIKNVTCSCTEATIDECAKCINELYDMLRDCKFIEYVIDQLLSFLDKKRVKRYYREGS
jgi:hypothetical protein